MFLLRVLLTREVVGPWSLVSRDYVELYFFAFLEIGSADVLHVEENVLAVLGIVRFDETVALPVVEEAYRTFCHLQLLEGGGYIYT